MGRRFARRVFVPREAPLPRFFCLEREGACQPRGVFCRWRRPVRYQHIQAFPVLGLARVFAGLTQGRVPAISSKAVFRLV
jgi:hypothetical protein